MLERAGRRLDELAEAAAAAAEGAAGAEAAAAGAAATEEAEAAEALEVQAAAAAAADEGSDADGDVEAPELGSVSRGTRKQRKAKARHAAVRAAIGLDDEYEYGALGEGVAVQ